MAAKAQVGRHLRGVARRTARRAGIDVRRLGLHTRPELRRARLLQLGGFDVVFDVGANRGDYARQLRDCGYDRRIVSFEPLAEPFGRLCAAASGDQLWDCHRFALGSEAAVRPIHVAANAGASSSFLDMSPQLHASDESVRYVGTEHVEVRTLDAVAAELLDPAARVWLKLDVQGYELTVLRGARETLRQVHCLEVEMSLVALYESQPLMHDVLAVSRTLGFELFDIEPAYRDPVSGRVLQVDGIALRPGSAR